MIDTTLQAGPFASPLLLAPLDEGPVSLALSVTAAVLGLAVGYVAFQGYRRNDSLPMLFVSAGFLLTFWTPVFLLGLLALLKATVSFSPQMTLALPWAVQTAARVSEIVGLLVLLYGLAMPIRE